MTRFGSTLVGIFMMVLVSGDALGGGPCIGQPDDFPCDDGDDCTVDDQCTAEVCAGTYQADLFADIAAPFGVVDMHDVVCALDGFANSAVCPAGDFVGFGTCTADGVISFDDVLAILNAMAGFSPCPDPCPLQPCEGDADCADGLFCSGAETCVDGECLPGFDQCPGEACDEGTASCFPVDTLMSCQLSSPEIPLTGSVTLEMFLQNATHLRAYQTRIAITRTSGTGMLTVGPCDGVSGVLVDTGRPDHVFFAVNGGLVGVDCDGLRAGSATIFASQAQDVGPIPGYLSTYTIEAPVDVAIGSTFELVVLPPPHSFIFDGMSSVEQPLALSAPCVVTVVVGDCQNNGVPDDCDVSCGAPGGPCDVPGCGTSPDCNANGFPDECEPDCNGNGIPDSCDVVDGTSPDCNGNGIPDDCEDGACCVEADQCAQTTMDLCQQVGGVFLGVCEECPGQSVALIPEGDGSVFVHIIGPPVECPTGDGPLPSIFCEPGEPFTDPWESPVDGRMCHSFGVADSPAIPADFFGPGSDPFVGAVCLAGVPLGIPEFGDADTLIERTEDPFDRCSLPPEGPATVAIDIAALSLASTDPITVTFNGGQNPEQWDASVDLSEVTPPSGSLTATKTHCNGGTYTSLLNVQPRFTFTKVSDPKNVQVLDTGLAGIPPVTLDQTDPIPWVHDVDENLGLMGDVCSSFHPGVADTSPQSACDCNENLVRDTCDIENCTPGDVACQDCNENGIPDECDIADGTSIDDDKDGVPDECPDCTVCLYGDITSAVVCVPTCTGAGTDVDFDDVLCALNGFALAGDCPCADIAGAVETPCTPDGVINFDDILAVLNAFAGDSTCPDPCI